MHLRAVPAVSGGSRRPDPHVHSRRRAAACTAALWAAPHWQLQAQPGTCWRKRMAPAARRWAGQGLSGCQGRATWTGGRCCRWSGATACPGALQSRAGRLPRGCLRHRASAPACVDRSLPGPVLWLPCAQFCAVCIVDARSCIVPAGPAASAARASLPAAGPDTGLGQHQWCCLPALLQLWCRSSELIACHL